MKCPPSVKDRADTLLDSENTGRFYNAEREVYEIRAYVCGSLQIIGEWPAAIKEMQSPFRADLVAQLEKSIWYLYFYGPPITPITIGEKDE